MIRASSSGSSPSRVAVSSDDDRVRRDDPSLGLDLCPLERDDARVLGDQRSGVVGEARQAAHPGALVERPVGRMEDPAQRPVLDRRRKLGRLAPLDGEPVGGERLALGANRGELLLGGRHAEAPDRPERVARERANPLDRLLARVHDVRQPDQVVRRRGAAQGEAAVPPARARSRAPRLEHAHARARLGERAGAGEPGDAGAHHGDVHRLVPAERPNDGAGRVEPVGVSIPRS